MQAAETTPIAHSDAEVRASREWAEFYRAKGYNVLPSRPDDKRPFVRWSQYADEPCPREVFERFDTANVQLMTGRRWGLMVIDLDGPEAVARWAEMAPGLPRTWVTHSGGDGRHLWFSAPPDGPPIPSGRLWGVWEPDLNEGRGAWKKHVAIEVIGDRKLIMAPPSIHPKTGRKYRFLARHSPREVGHPLPAPRWVLGLPIIQPPRPAWEPKLTAPAEAPAGFTGARFDRRAVLESVPDKPALAASWGLRLAVARPNAEGWMSCHAIDREDRTPSASLHAETGRYWEPGQRTISLFDLAARLGAYPDWWAAVEGLGRRHCPHLMAGEGTR